MMMVNHPFCNDGDDGDGDDGVGQQEDVRKRCDPAGTRKTLQHPLIMMMMMTRKNDDDDDEEDDDNDDNDKRNH